MRWNYFFFLAFFAGAFFLALLFDAFFLAAIGTSLNSRLRCVRLRGSLRRALPQPPHPPPPSNATHHRRAVDRLSREKSHFEGDFERRITMMPPLIQGPKMPFTAVSNGE